MKSLFGLIMLLAGTNLFAQTTDENEIMSP
jgi:hypothetical protein